MTSNCRHTCLSKGHDVHNHNFTHLLSLEVLAAISVNFMVSGVWSHVIS